MIHTQCYSVKEVVGYINWLYFFHAWHFPSHYGKISRFHSPDEYDEWLYRLPLEEHPRAKEAYALWNDAQIMLQAWQNEALCLHFRVALLPACSVGDDVWLPTENMTLPFLRQQSSANDGPCLCWADFIRPKSCAQWDTLGVFAATVEPEMEQWGKDDPYMCLLAQTLADRLAEAATELGHLHVRRTLWGYAAQEDLAPDDLFASRYQGCRPAVGYPSLPDQSLNFQIARLLSFETMGITLTENGAMIPHASTSGLMFSHPACRYFSIGTIGEDQLCDYAKRRGLPFETVWKFLGRYSFTADEQQTHAEYD